MLHSIRRSFLGRARFFGLCAVAVAHSASAASQCTTPPDALEPNGDCVQATPATLPYSVAGLSVGFGDTDFFRITVPAGVVLEATVSVPQSSTGPVIVGIIDGPSCFTLAGAGFAIGFPGGQETARWANRTGAPADVVVNCRNELFSCGLYSLVLATAPDPCLAPPADIFEPNDDCGSASLISPGVYAGLQGGIPSLDEDIFRVTILPGHRVEVAAASVPPGIAMDVESWSVECGLPPFTVDASPGRASVLNRGSSPVDFAFRVTMSEGLGYTEDACGGYELSVASTPSPCIGVPSDAFEPNDSCAAARPITSGFYPGLTLESEQDPDWFQGRLRRGEQLTMEVSYDSQLTQLFPLFLQNCAFGLVPFQTPTPTGFRVVWANNTPGDYDAQFGVTIPVGEPLACSRYDMNVIIGPIMDPCPMDMFENAFGGGDDCASALLIGDGMYWGLHVGAVDDDHYEVEVAPGALLTMEVIADLDASFVPRLEIYSLGWPCIGAGDIVSGRSLFRGLTAQWINDTGLTQRVRASVTLPGLFDTCAEYDLLVLGTTTPGLLGDQFCPSRLNSLLTRALTLAEGSTSISAQDLDLVAQPLPFNSNGFFLYSQAQSSPTPVSGGLLCLGSPIVRLNQYVLNSTDVGVVTLALPYGSLPVPIFAGETWSFQYWYRNTLGGQGSNFGTGLTLQFTP